MKYLISLGLVIFTLAGCSASIGPQPAATTTHHSDGSTTTVVRQ